MNEVLTAEQMRTADATAIRKLRIPSLKLMESAGKAVADRAVKIIQTELKKNVSRCRVGILCGKGNNGGDGLVAARLLVKMKCKTHVVVTGRALSADAAVQLKRLPRNASVSTVETPELWKREKNTIAGCDLIVDALFGTGLSQPLAGLFLKIVNDVNAMGIPVVAADIPSGIDGTTGLILGGAIAAHTTVTFARPKIGHILHPGAALAGRLIVADIGIPDAAIAQARPDTFLMDRKTAASLLPPRPAHSHKGTFGRSIIFAGSRGMIGAAALATEAAMRIGSGLTELYVPENMYAIAAKKLPPEAMCRPATDFTGLKHAAAVLIGPGMGRDPKTVRFIIDLLKRAQAESKWVIDADALYALATAKQTWPVPRTIDAVITPHAGEMARLVNRGRQTVERNPLHWARQVSTSKSVTVVLKGSRTILSDRDGRAFINPTGNPALAKGGSGDVLAGMICGLCAQGLSTFDAARLAVYLHGRTADIAVERGRNPRTFLASDIFKYLDDSLAELFDKRV